MRQLTKYEVVAALDMGGHLEFREDDTTRESHWFLVWLEQVQLSCQMVQDLKDRGFISHCDDLSHKHGRISCTVTEDGREWLWKIREIGCD